jgi:DNA-binding Lrp family transcriptional regulator
LDSVDIALLYELQKSCRISFAILAENYKISIEEVVSRVNRLVNNHTILKFTVVPALSLFEAKDAILSFRSKEFLDLDRITLLGINSAIEFISVGSQSEGFALIHYRNVKELLEVASHFQQIHSSFEELRTYPVHPLVKSDKSTTKDLFAFEKIDWLMLAHLREQGRLALTELSQRTKFAPKIFADRLEFLRSNNLIEETIHFNPAITQRETLTLFKLELTLFTQPLQEELNRHLSALPIWKPSCWKVVDQNTLILGFLCESYTDVEKIQTFLLDIPGVKSIEKIMGGPTYYFQDFRDELIEEKRSHGWFSPEQWVTKR